MATVTPRPPGAVEQALAKPLEFVLVAKVFNSCFCAQAEYVGAPAVATVAPRPPGAAEGSSRWDGSERRTRSKRQQHMHGSYGDGSTGCVLLCVDAGSPIVLETENDETCSVSPSRLQAMYTQQVSAAHARQLWGQQHWVCPEPGNVHGRTIPEMNEAACFVGLRKVHAADVLPVEAACMQQLRMQVC